MLTYGSGLGFFAFGQAIAVHSLSCFDAVLTGRGGAIRPRVLTGILITCLLLPVYLGTARTLSRWIDARHLVQIASPFFRNDAILINPLAYRSQAPQVGDVAIYDVPRATLRRGAEGVGNVVFQVQGERFDRILAGPGDRFLWEAGKVYINDRPALHLPLGKSLLSTRWSCLYRQAIMRSYPV